MNIMILTNGKYIPTEIKFGRTLSEDTLALNPGSYHAELSNSFTTIDIVKQYNCVILALGSYKYYFELNGEFSMMLRANKRVNENFAEYNERLEYLMEVLQTAKLTKLNSL